MAVGRALPPRAGRGGPHRGRGGRAASSSATPRPTSSSRRSPSCGRPAGCGRGCSTRVAGAAESATAPARRHQPRDDGPSRPVGQHAARHRRRLRGRCRRCRRRHGGALRRTAGPSGRLRPPDRPQHLVAADRGVPRRRGHRPRRRVLRGGEAHRRPRRRRVGRARPDRGGRRRARRAGPGRGEGAGRGRAPGPRRRRHRGPVATADRHLGVPEPRRGASRARAAPGPRRASALRLRRTRTCGPSPRAAAGLPRHHGPDRRAHRPRDLRDQPPRRRRRGRRGGRAHRHVVGRGRDGGLRRPARGVPRRHRRGVRRVGCRPRRRAARGRSVVRRAGRAGRGSGP